MQQIGVRAVLETSKFEAGLKRYMDGLDAAIAKTLKFQDTLNNLRTAQSPTVRPPTGTGQPAQQQVRPITQIAPNINQIGLINTSNINAGTAAVRGLGQAAQQTGGQVGFLNQIITGMAYSIGGAITNALRGLGSALVDFGSNALKSVIDFESLKFSITGLIAQEHLASGAVDNFADAMAMATPRAEELLTWITRLAIESPFGESGVAAVFQQALAFGFAADEAQLLTQQIVDYASVNRKSEDEMRRIAYALGQIRNEGKLLTRDMRQLTNVGVRVDLILEKMGYSMNDLGKVTISSAEFLQAYTEYMQAFEGGAKEASMSLGGVMNSFEDIGQVISRSLATPVFDAMLPHLNALKDSLYSSVPVWQLVGNEVGNLVRFFIEFGPRITNVVLSIGALVGAFMIVANAGVILTAAMSGITAILGGIGAAFLFLISPIGLLAVAVGGLAALFVLSFENIRDASGNLLSGMGDDMFTWGYNITVQFANGMAAGIGAVIDVLLQIGWAIAAWLQPGSPPRILPELDRWGEEAANVYMDGWSKMNFDVFNDLSGTFESFIRSFAGISIPETEIVPRIQGMNDAFAQVIQQLKDFGTVSEEAIAQAVQAIGIADPAVERYIRDLIALEGANNAVREAQERLNAITARYAAELAPINEELNEINKRRQEVKDQERSAELNAIINDENAPALAKELALMELREIELKKQKGTIEEQQAAEEARAKGRLDAAKEEQARLKAQADATKALIDAQQNQNKLINEQIKLLERIAKAEEARGRGGSGVPVDIDPVGGIGGLGGGFGGLGEFNIDELVAKFENAKKDLLAPFDELGGELDLLGIVWGRVFTLMGASWERFRKDPLKEMEQIFTKNIPDWIRDLQKNHGDWGAAGIVTAVAGIGLLIARFAILPTLFTPIGLLVVAVSALILVISLFGGQIMRDFTGIVDNAGKIIGYLAEKFGEAWLASRNLGASILIVWGEFTSLLLRVNPLLGTWFATLTALPVAILAIFFNIGQGIGDFILWIGRVFTEYFDSSNGKVAVTISGLGGWWVGAWNQLASTLEGVWDGIVTWAEDSIEDVKTAIETTVTNIQTWWDTTWNAISTFFSTTWADMVTKTDEEIDKIQTSIDTTYNEVKTFIETTWEGIKTFFSTKWTEMLAAVSSTLTLINSIITTVINALKTWWDEEWTEFTATVTTTWSNIKTGIEEKIGEAREVIEGFLNGIVAWFADPQQVAKVWKLGADFALGFKEGIEDKVHELVEVARNLIERVLGAANAALGNPQSPAPETIPLGEAISMGIAKGIDNQAKLVERSMTNIVDMVKDTKIDPPCTDPVIPQMPPVNQGYTGARGGYTGARRKPPGLIGPPINDDWSGLVDPVLREVRRRVGFLGPPQRTLAQSAIPFGATSNNNSVALTVSFNDIKINNGMDMQNFAGQVREAVIEALDTTIGHGT